MKILLNFLKKLVKKAMGVIINEASLQAKLNKVSGSKAGRAAKLNSSLLASRLREMMIDEISAAGDLTGPERDRVLSVGITCSSTSASANGEQIVTIRLDFSGDKTMVSLSPNKSVQNLVALFNNGYASNNIDPSRPIRGIWHGKMITIGPRSRSGAHFVQSAVEKFTNMLTSQGAIVHSTISPEYK